MLYGIAHDVAAVFTSTSWHFHCDRKVVRSVIEYIQRENMTVFKTEVETI